MTTAVEDQEIPGFTDPDAPYGRTTDGTPKRKPGRKPGPSVPNLTPPKRSSAKKGQTDYTEGLTGLLQLVSLPLMVAGQKSDAAAADAYAVAEHGPAIVSAVNDLAQEMPAVANALDRLLSAGPYAALVAAVLPLGVQIATNHRLIPQPVANSLGAKDPAQMADAMRASARRMAQQAQAQAAQAAA